MKFEKLNDNKIRIVLNNQDLCEKNIDFNSFMSNSIETQDLFLEMLNEAEEKVGFITKDYKIKIEALAMENGDFVVIVTRFDSPEEQDESRRNKSRKLTSHKKIPTASSDSLVYLFNNFEDFCIFSNQISSIRSYTTLAKTTSLYTYESKYYLLFSKVNTNHPEIKRFYASITEYAKHVSNPDLFARKLGERGKIVIKNNAIKTCIAHFS